MTRLRTAAFLAITLLTAPAAFAGQKTVTFAVRNMYCAACPAIVKGSLTAVPGVTSVAVSYGRKTAVVTFDDAKTNVPALITATTNAGYPSAPAN
jgi:periplasmic mercuric ion binding protein